MSIVKIAVGAACGLISLLLYLSVSVKNPEVGLYEKTIQRLMEKEGMSMLEMKECFPEIIEIQSNLNRIADLKNDMKSQAFSPDAIIAGEEELPEVNHMKRIQQLQASVTTALSQLDAVYTADQP